MVGLGQRISTITLADGTHVAHASSGQGPPLVYVAGWLTHLEMSWAMPPERRFYEALSEGRTLVRYDRPGCGVSGPTQRSPTITREVEVLDAVVQAIGEGPIDLLGTSFGASVATRWAATHQPAVGHLILYGGWLRGTEVASVAVRQHLLGLVQSHWGLGSDVLTDIFAPGCDPATRAAFVNYQRAASSPEMAVQLLTLSYEVDLSEIASRLHVPTLVLHRDGDRAAPLGQGAALASSIATARLEVLPGHDHLPYIGEANEVDLLTGAVRTFLGLPPLGRGVTPELTPRQREVAALVSAGLHNREIGARLHINERTAEGHVERIRQRLGFRSRAQIAAWFVATYGDD